MYVCIIHFSSLLVYTGCQDSYTIMSLLLIKFRCVYVCVCVCVYVRVYVCTCVCACVYELRVRGLAEGKARTGCAFCQLLRFNDFRSHAHLSLFQWCSMMYEKYQSD